MKHAKNRDFLISEAKVQGYFDSGLSVHATSLKFDISYTGFVNYLRRHPNITLPTKRLNPIQQRILVLAEDIGKERFEEMSLRKIAKTIGMVKQQPQQIKYHLLALKKKGYLNY